MKEAIVINYIVTEEGTAKVESLDAEKMRLLLNALKLETIKSETSKKKACDIF